MSIESHLTTSASTPFCNAKPAPWACWVFVIIAAIFVGVPSQAAIRFSIGIIDQSVNSTSSHSTLPIIERAWFWDKSSLMSTWPPTTCSPLFTIPSSTVNVSSELEEMPILRSNTVSNSGIESILKRSSSQSSMFSPHRPQAFIASSTLES